MAVRAARAAKGLTQTELGNEVGVDWTTISNIERGTADPDFSTIETIADVLKSSLDALVGRHSPKSEERVGLLDAPPNWLRDQLLSDSDAEKLETLIHENPALAEFLKDPQSAFRQAAAVMSETFKQLGAYFEKGSLAPSALNEAAFVEGVEQADRRVSAIEQQVAPQGRRSARSKSRAKDKLG